MECVLYIVSLWDLSQRGKDECQVRKEPDLQRPLLLIINNPFITPFAHGDPDFDSALCSSDFEKKLPLAGSIVAVAGFFHDDFGMFADFGDDVWIRT